jgi:hypothetical protein
MKRLWFCGLAGFLFLLGLAASGRAYILEIHYDAYANQADAYASNGAIEQQPGPVYGPGEVSQSAATAPTASGTATTRQTVATGDHLDAASWIIHAAASSGHTDASSYYGYSQGYGQTIFAFKVIPGPGEPNLVSATIGFTVNGSVNLEQSGDNNQLILNYAGALKQFRPNSDLPVAGETKTWNSLISNTFGNGKEVTVKLRANQLYVFSGYLQVDAGAYGYDFAGRNSLTFEATVSIKNLKAAAVIPSGVISILLQ